MIDIMLDTETLSTEPNAHILSIGAVAFDPYDEPPMFNDVFYANITIQDKFDRHISASTTEWWFLQALRNPKALSSLFFPTPVPLDQALNKFIQWILSRTAKPRFIWANSPSFDCTILKSACKAANVPWPFMYHEERDVRTIISLAYPDRTLVPKFTSDSTEHDALDDAIKQARLVQHCHQLLGAHRM